MSRHQNFKQHELKLVGGDTRCAGIRGRKRSRRNNSVDVDVIICVHFTRDKSVSIIGIYGLVRHTTLKDTIDVEMDLGNFHIESLRLFCKDRKSVV